MQLSAVAGLGESGHRLAHLADRPALQAELAEIDDRLVAEVDRAQAERLVERAELLAGADRAEPQAAGLSECLQLFEQRREGARRTDRIAGEQEHAVLDPVADERLLVGAEEVLLVAAQLEERQRVGAVAADELSGGGAGRRARQRAR